MRNEESRIQQACVRWFRYQYPQYARLLFAVPNGGARSAATAAILKGEGVVSGVADILLLVPNSKHHGLCIEMKTRIGRQSDNQKTWQAEVERQGYKYIVCRNVDSFIEDVRAYLDD